MAEAQLHPRRWSALVLLCAANFVVILDSQIVILALPSIAMDLQMTPSSSQWVLTANLVAFGGLLLLGGRAADLLGRRRMFMIGTALFLIVSVLSGLAWNTEVMLIARVLHGVSSALMAPTALSILMNMFPEGAERNKALAGWAGIAGIGATVGLLIGGALTDSLGWEWVFYVNAPVALIMLLLSPALLQESTDKDQERTYDLAGALTSTGALALIIYAIADVPTAGWTSDRTLGLLAGAAVLIVLFVIIELKSANPLVPLRIFKSRSMVGGNLVMLMFGMLAFGFSVSASVYAQQVLGWSAFEFGYKQAVMPLLAFVGAYVGQAFVTRFGFQPVAIISLILTGAGSLLLTQISPTGNYVDDLLVGLIVFGPGLGAGAMVSGAAALAGFAEKDSGLASGFNTAAFQVGGAFGVSVIVTTMVSKAVGNSPPEALTNGLQSAIGACVIFAAVGLFFALTILRGGRSGHVAKHSVHM